MKAIKTLFENISEEALRVEEEKKKIEASIKDARNGIVACSDAMTKALDNDSMDLFIEARKHKEEYENKIEYYEKLLAKKGKESKKSYTPFLKEIYAEAVQEYIIACKDCVAAIETLEAKSKYAEEIVMEYNKAISNFKAYVAFDPNPVLPVPEIFPNLQAVGLAKGLQYQKRELGNMPQNLQIK